MRIIVADLVVFPDSRLHTASIANVGRSIAVKAYAMEAIQQEADRLS